MGCYKAVSAEIFGNALHLCSQRVCPQLNRKLLCISRNALNTVLRIGPPSVFQLAQGDEAFWQSSKREERSRLQTACASSDDDAPRRSR